MFCPNCGKETQPNQKYCSNCGTIVSGKTRRTVKVKKVACAVDRASEGDDASAKQIASPVLEDLPKNASTPTFATVRDADEKEQSDQADKSSVAYKAGKLISAIKRKIGELSGTSKRKLVIAALVVVAFGFILLGLGTLFSQGNGRSEPDVAAPQQPTYELHVTVSCEANFLFDRYDVDLYIDGEKAATVEHGGEVSFDMKLGAGSHKLETHEKGSSTIRGSRELTMPSEAAQLTFSLKCSGSEIEINNFTIVTSKVALQREQEKAKAEAERQEAAAAKANEEAERQREAAAAAEAERARLEAEGAKTPRSAGGFRATDYAEAVSQLSAAGFVSITAIPLYDLDSPEGGFFSGDPGKIKSISIAGNVSFKKDDLFEKDAEVSITYHSWKYDDPSLVYNSYAVADLLNELEGNAMRAKSNHDDELVQLEGYVGDFDASGSYFTLKPDNNRWTFDSITCDVDSEAQRAALLNYSSGDYICIQGRITLVGEILGYRMDLHRVM